MLDFLFYFYLFVLDYHNLTVIAPACHLPWLFNPPMGYLATRQDTVCTQYSDTGGEYGCWRVQMYVDSVYLCTDLQKLRARVHNVHMCLDPKNRRNSEGGGGTTAEASTLSFVPIKKCGTLKN